MSAPKGPYYPDDYKDLTKEGQKLARLHAVSTWSSPDEYVRAWTNFRTYYLLSTEDGFFYKTKPTASPPAHYQWVHDYENFMLNLMGAPRHSAKSQIIGREVPLHRALTMNYREIMLVLCSKDLVKDRFLDLKRQLVENERIIEDFGIIKPSKGVGSWGEDLLQLNHNGAILRGVSVDSRKRGLHPHEIILDDPEYDPSVEGAVSTTLRKHINTFLFKVVLPMIEEGEKDAMRIYWLGTMLNRQSALYEAAYGDDSRFQYWNRRVYPIYWANDEGKKEYFWASRWGEPQIKRKRQIMGEAAFQAECMNNPVSESDLVFVIHKDWDTYKLIGDKVVWAMPGAEMITEWYEADWSKTLGAMTTVMLVDSAYSLSPRADNRAVLVLGVDSRKWWWLLDLFIGKCPEAVLIDRMYQMGAQWEVARVGIEEAGLQTNLAADYDAKLAEYRNQSATDSEMWAPHVIPVKYSSRMSKGQRIMGLGGKFSRHQIKFPAHLKHRGSWSQMWEQVTNFTIDLALLRQDNAIDCLAEMLYVRAPILGNAVEPADPRERLIALIQAGHKTDPVTGMPLYQLIDPMTIDPDVFIRLGAQDHINEKRRREGRWTPQNYRKKLRAQGPVMIPALRRDDDEPVDTNSFGTRIGGRCRVVTGRSTG